MLPPLPYDPASLEKTHLTNPEIAYEIIHDGAVKRNNNYVRATGR